MRPEIIVDAYGKQYQWLMDCCLPPEGRPFHPGRAFETVLVSTPSLIFSPDAPCIARSNHRNRVVYPHQNREYFDEDFEYNESPLG